MPKLILRRVGKPRTRETSEVCLMDLKQINILSIYTDVEKGELSFFSGEEVQIVPSREHRWKDC